MVHCVAGEQSTYYTPRRDGSTKGHIGGQTQDDRGANDEL